ncbi:MAG: M23 family metallopeptidase [Ruminococcaceae bacterium]|nr:M23 family metallopeptidase [Oscillospiraceae bacterium]
MKQNFFKSNISLRIAVCLLLFIPLIIAIIYGLNVDPLSVTPGNLEKVTVTTPEGSKFNITDKESIDFYTSLTVDATDISADFRDLTKETPYIITFFEKNSDPVEYKLYTHEKTTDYVCIIPENQHFLLSQQVASKLISRQEFSKKTDLSEVLPVVSMSAFGVTTNLAADSCEWTYTQEDGSKASISVPSGGKTNPVVKFDLTENGLPKFNSDKKPDKVTITILPEDSNEPIYEGTVEDIKNSNRLTYTHDAKLKATLVAEWFELEGAEFFGKSTYNFDLLFDVAPTYRVVDTKALPTGDFTVLRITDFNDGELLTIVNSMGIPEKVNVYSLADSDVKITFIPLGSTLGTATHKLTLKTDLGQEFDISVSTKEPDTAYGSQMLLINEETDSNLSAAFSKAALTEIDELVQKYTSESTNEMLYDGAFAYPTGSSRVVDGGASYGTTRTVFSINSAQESYISMGHDLECMTDQNIVAANNGKVVFAADTTLFGKTVIIDHGYGILSYYGNLSSINVKAGDMVEKKNSIIGIAGSTGFACADTGVSGTTKTMCHYAVSMNGVFVAPRSVFNGIFIK